MSILQYVGTMFPCMQSYAILTVPMKVPSLTEDSYSTDSTLTCDEGGNSLDMNNAGT